MSEERMADRLAAAADRSEIGVVIERYFHTMDARDWAGFADCFTEGAVMTLHHGTGSDTPLNGRRAIAETIQGRIDSYDATVHARGNVEIALDGDRARASTHAVAYILLKGAVLVRGLRYVDELERAAAGSWRIARRLHIPLWQYEAPAVTPSIVHRER